MVFDGGVVLAADTRATGELVVDKNCEKLKCLAPNIYSAGAGTAADCRMLAREVSSQLELLRLNMQQEQPKVVTAVTLLKRKLFQHQGHLEAALIIGGVNNGKSYLFPVAPHGSTDSTCYCTQGSGMLAAMAVLESRYKDDLTQEEAMEICSDAILAGIFNDLGSGSNVDLVVIKHKETLVLRGYKTMNQVAPLRAAVRLPAGVFQFPVGRTKYMSEKVEVFVKEEEEEHKMQVE